jgi:hypothetical protein
MKEPHSEDVLSHFGAKHNPQVMRAAAGRQAASQCLSFEFLPKCDSQTIPFDISEPSDLFDETRSAESTWRHMQTHLKGLILAQNERWRRGLGMQVE